MDKILLERQEIAKLPNCGVDPIKGEVLTKAQLKRVVKWFAQYGKTTENISGLGQHFYRHFTVLESDWQALIKEAED